MPSRIPPRAARLIRLRFKAEGTSGGTSGGKGRASLRFRFPKLYTRRVHPPTVQTPQPASLVGLPPGIIDISAPGYNARALLGGRQRRALQFTNQANFVKRFDTNPLETYKIHNSIRKNILSNFVSAELEQGERVGGLAGWGLNPSSQSRNHLLCTPPIYAWWLITELK